MKINKWTVALAAVGLVSLPAVLQAEEKLSPVQTALASTVISGYVNTAAQLDFGTGSANVPNYIYNTPNKNNAFSLNVVDLTIEKALDEAQWSAGYRVDLWFGQDANTFGSQSPLAVGGSDFAIRQGYVALRAPVGNGLDFKMGAFDTIIGYESHDAGKNPNYSRSYGTTIEPHTSTGLLMAYQFSELIGVKGGFANTYGPSINQNSVPDGQDVNTTLTYMAALQLTAPKEMGFLEGSTLYAGVVNGQNSAVAGDGGTGNDTSWYLGATVATPVKELKVGAAFDYNDLSNAGFAWNIAGYASFQCSEKFSLHGRAEYLQRSDSFLGYTRGANGVSTTVLSDGTEVAGFPTKIFETTITAQYDLWKNVMSRLEFRWDHSADGSNAYGGTSDVTGANPDLMNALSVALNVIYMF